MTVFSASRTELRSTLYVRHTCIYGVFKMQDDRHLPRGLLTSSTCSLQPWLQRVVMDQRFVSSLQLLCMLLRGEGRVDLLGLLYLPETVVQHPMLPRLLYLATSTQPVRDRLLAVRPISPISSMQFHLPYL